jgi:hypothetical protein
MQRCSVDKLNSFTVKCPIMLHSQRDDLTLVVAGVKNEG